MSINRLIAISVDPGVEEGALYAADTLRRAGFRTQLFLNTGEVDSGIENSILHNPSIEAVLEYSLIELVSRQVGLSPPDAPERLTSVAMRGIPQVIVPGSLDHLLFQKTDVLPESRRYLEVDASTCLLRTSEADNDLFGKQIAFKASASTGKVCIVMPRGGLSKWDGVDQLAFDPQANQVLLDSIYLWKSPQVEVVESHRHINDPHFAQIAVDQLLKLCVQR